MKNKNRFIAALFLIVSACSGESSTAPDNSTRNPTYQVIAGNYNGTMVGLSQGVAMNSNFSLNISQTAAVTSGTWALSGVLSDGVNTLQITGTGTLDGSVGSGTNPSVNITIKAPACPSYRANFSGAYDSVNRRITITGPVDVFAANSCTVALSYNTTLILNR